MSNENERVQIKTMKEPIVPPKEVYAKEALYMESLSDHSKAFSKLLDTLPEGRNDLKQTFIGLWNTKPDRLLNSDKLAKLKEDDTPLFFEVSSIYKTFLEEQLGLSESKN